MRAHWDEHGFGYWCVLEPGSDRSIGYAGVKRVVAKKQPVLNVFYRFAPDLWGRGYATEAAEGVLSWTASPGAGETSRGAPAPREPGQSTRGDRLGLHRDRAMDESGEDGPD